MTRFDLFSLSCHGVEQTFMSAVISSKNERASAPEAHPCAEPTRESPGGLPYPVASAQKKETPGEAPGVEVGYLPSRHPTGTARPFTIQR